jgi:hypothetical protein
MVLIEVLTGKYTMVSCIQQPVQEAALIAVISVGGARNQRQAWAPYFEDGNIFCHTLQNKDLTIEYSECNHLSGTDIRVRSSFS